MEAEPLLRIVPVLILVLAAFVGCVAPGGTTEPANAPTGNVSVFVPPAPTFDFSKVVDPSHASHQLPDLHTGGHGLALAGFTGIQSILSPGTRGSITQVDVSGHYAVVSGMEGGLAFALVDIADPANPKPVSWWPSTADGWTARFSDDGNYVFYGCQMFGAPYTPLNSVKGTCKDPNEVHAPATEAGVVVVDVKDKAHPKFVDFLPTAGSHNIFVTSINGTDYVFTAAVTILKFDREKGKLAEIAKVAGVHDATVARHPLTKDWLLITGAGAGDFAMYNVNDPADPSVVYNGANATDHVVGWHEQTLIPGLVDGRVVLALGGETGTSPTGGPVDEVTFVDVTDPTHPTKLSTWKPPFMTQVPWTSYLFSIHEMAATPTGQIAVSWYHGGVWVLDVSTKERQAKPVVLAAYQPHNMIDVVPSTFAQTPLPYVPFVWGAGWDARGYLVVPDMHTGVYVLKPDWGLVPTGVDGGQ